MASPANLASQPDRTRLVPNTDVVGADLSFLAASTAGRKQTPSECVIIIHADLLDGGPRPDCPDYSLSLAPSRPAGLHRSPGAAS